MRPSLTRGIVCFLLISVTLSSSSGGAGKGPPAPPRIPESSSYVCAACNGPAHLKCTRCQQVHYCSKACQRLHWKEGHKKICQPAQAEAGAGAGKLKKKKGKASDGAGAGGSNSPVPAGRHPGSQGDLLRRAAAMGVTDALRALLQHRQVREFINSTASGGNSFKDTDTTCGICLEDYAEGDHVEVPMVGQTENSKPYQLPCGHRFHWQCIRKWARDNSATASSRDSRRDQRSEQHFSCTCPTCRTDTTKAAEEGMTALMFAARNRQPAAVRLLLDAGADTSLTRGEYRVTALCFAAGSGCGQCIKLLLSRGDLEGQNLGGALRYAARQGQVGSAVQLLAAGADTSTVLPGTLQTPLVTAIGLGQTPAATRSTIVRLLINHGALEGQNTGFALMMAAQEGHEEVVGQLLAAGADVGFRNPGMTDETPLFHAVSRGHTAIVRLLLDHGKLKEQCIEVVHMLARREGLAELAQMLKAAMDAHNAEVQGTVVTRIEDESGEWMELRVRKPRKDE